MPYGTTRPLTEREWSALSAGLAQALALARVRPLIIARPAIGARISRLWRGRTPVLAWRSRIYWPGATQDFSGEGRAMAVLQHELQHLLEYATGDLTVLGYALDPKNWTYAYRLGPEASWSDFGAEQRAQIVQDLWLVEHGLADGKGDLALYRNLPPWSRPEEFCSPGPSFPPAGA